MDGLHVFYLICGAVLGACLSIIVLGLCVAARDRDEEERKVKKRCVTDR